MSDVVNVGTGVGTKDGDKARVGGTAINSKFAALDASIAGLGAPLLSSAFSQFTPAVPLDATETFPLVQSAGNVIAPVTFLGRRFGFISQITLSTQPNIDTTGVTDSWAGFTAAYALSLSTGKPLIVDCKCKLTIGIDDSKCIFLRTGTNIVGTPSGELIVDNSYIPAFILLHTTDFVIRNLNVKYVGAAPYDDLAAPYPALTAHFNDVIMKNDMIANFGNTFTGSGSCLYTGHGNPSAIFRCQGALARGRFENVSIYVPQGANAANFIPFGMSFDEQWAPNTLVTNNNQAINASTAVLPTDVDIINLRLDGCYMGIFCRGGVRIHGLKGYRYSDLQHSDGTGAGGSLSWFPPPHLLYISDPDPSFTGWTREVVNCFDYGIYVGGATRRSTTSGSMVSLKMAPCLNTVIDGYTSLRPDGFMDCLTNNYPNGYGTMKNLSFVYDSSVVTSNGLPIWGLRFPSGAPYNYLTIENLVARDLNPAPTVFPIADMGNNNNQNCDFKGVKVYLPDWPSTGSPGFSIAGNFMTIDADYYFNTYSSDQTFRGSASLQGSAVMTNSDVNVRVHGFRVYPVVFATPPTGTSTALASNWTHSTGLYLLQFNDNQVRYATLTNGATTCTWAATGAGALAATATMGASGTGSTATITFATTSGIATVGTQVTIAGVTPAGYNGTFTVTASAPGSVSYANATTGAQTVAGTIANFVNATAQNGLGANYSGYKQRMLSMQGGKAIGNRIRIMDLSNGLESICQNGAVEEKWSQVWSGTPPAGLTFDLPIAVPATHNPDLFTATIATALGTSGGLTSWALGWSATPAALANTISPSVSTTIANAGPVTTNAGTIRTIRMTATGGTGFDGTGLVIVSVRCSSSQGAG